MRNSKHIKEIAVGVLKDVRFYLLLVLYVAMIICMIQAWRIHLFPMKYLIPIYIVIIFVGFLMYWMQYSKKVMKVNQILGKVIIVIFLVVSVGVNVYLSQTHQTLDKISVDVGDKDYDYISVVVKKENKAAKLEDVAKSTFAIPKKIDIQHTTATIKEINKALKTNIKTKDYINTNDQAKALYSGNVDAIILNEAYRTLLDDNFPSFTKDTKVIYTYKIPKTVKNISKKVDIHTESYNVYISGIDTYGPIATKSRSDVNMIATINPNTHTILLTSVPRDYYVAQTCQGGQKDKLTHTGIFGIDCTVESMNAFTGLTFNYYVRVNFSSLEKIVNAIGGIDVYNQMSFYSGVDGTFIPEGNVHMSGATALKFARERHAYGDGDRQRGRNQMIVLEAIIKKAASPSIITGYARIMDAIGGSVQTNMSQKEITSIVNKELDKGIKWKVEQQGVTGNGKTTWSPANGFNAYVMVPNQASVQDALSNIHKVMKGETITIKK